MLSPQAAGQILEAHFAEWVRALDLEVRETGAGQALLRMPLGAHLARSGGIVSGQALAALADTAMVIAAIAGAGGFRPFATTDLHVQFLRPGTGGAILCRATVVRAGRALVFTRAEMTGEDDGRIVATATATLYAP